MKKYKWLIQGIALLTLWNISIYAVKDDGKYFTRNGFIKFYSSTSVENIEAKNYKVTSVLDLESGKIEFAVLVKAFEFEKALMEEHFNENYMESSEFPKAIFKGTLKGFKTTGTTPGKGQSVTAEGDLTIHGVTKHVSVPGTVTIQENSIDLDAVFSVNPENYNIKIPNTVRENIAKEIKITVDMTLKPLQK